MFKSVSLTILTVCAAKLIVGFVTEFAVRYTCVENGSGTIRHETPAGTLGSDEEVFTVKIPVAEFQLAEDIVLLCKPLSSAI
jgi:hypothetical protein